jgi:serine protease
MTTQARKQQLLRARFMGLFFLATAPSFAANYIVKFKNHEAFLAKSALKDTLPVMHNLDALNMAVVSSDDKTVIADLSRDLSIDYIEEEQFFAAPPQMSTGTGGAKKVSRKSEEVIPWGIRAIGADRAWARTKGQGARVVILDTGIDKDHPDLKDRFEQGKNFIIKSQDFSVTPAYDFFDQIGHGTHVAGTIAGAQNGIGVIGVAPEARVLAGRVCGKFGCSTISIVQGINWAIEQKVDAVNMSLGGPMTQRSQRDAVNAANASGVVIVAASGNDGKNVVSFPAAEDNALAVGAIDATLLHAAFSNWGPELDIAAPGVDVLSSVPTGTGRESQVSIAEVGAKLPSTSFVGAPLTAMVSGDLAFAGLGKPEDFAGFTAGKIALIARGEITFADKVKNAITARAKGVVVYNNTTGLISGALTQDGTEVAIPVVMIEQAQGEAAKLALASHTVSASLSITAADYAAFQGTSMASPHVAGVVALIRSANKNLSPEQVRNLIKKTATPAHEADPENKYGAGIINAALAVEQSR